MEQPPADMTPPPEMNVPPAPDAGMTPPMPDESLAAPTASPDMMQVDPNMIGALQQGY